MKKADVHRTVEAVWRIESPRLIASLASLARLTGDVGPAEELAQDALLAALENWPDAGVPDNPGAWLVATARHRAIDIFHRNSRLAARHEQLGHELELVRAPDGSDEDAPLDDPVGDDLLRLIFTACHPVLSAEARVALTLRLASVLEVIYLVFNEGDSATAGDDWVRPALCEEALRLGRILAQLAPLPVVELYCAVAVGMTFGPTAGLELADALLEEPSLRQYHLLPSVRGDLLARLGRLCEARAQFERAAGLTRNERERGLLLRRAAECGGCISDPLS